MRHFDVIVVGGGPAGSTCAYELAKAGVDVAIFDHSHPREKPCGGAISSRLFEYIDVPKRLIERSIDWLILESPNGSSIKIHEKNLGILIMRNEFDGWLLDRAKKSGARHFPDKVERVERKNSVWKVYTKNREFKCNFLVGADGINSIVRKYVIGQIPKIDIGHCVGYHIKHKSDYINKNFLDALEIYFLGQPYISSGYLWIFPKFEHITVGIGSKLGTRDLKKSLEYFLNNHSSARRIKIGKKGELHSHLVPAISNISFFNLPTSGPNWIIIGDAAGHVNPVTGEGIYYAIVGGILAAKCYKGGEIKNFNKMWMSEYGNDLYYGALIQKFFYKKFFINKIIKKAIMKSKLQKTLLDLVFTRDDYRKILIRLFFNFI